MKRTWQSIIVISRTSMLIMLLCYSMLGGLRPVSSLLGNLHIRAVRGKCHMLPTEKPFFATRLFSTDVKAPDASVPPRYKILFFGTPSVAAEVLKTLHESSLSSTSNYKIVGTRTIIESFACGAMRFDFSLVCAPRKGIQLSPCPRNVDAALSALHDELWRCKMSF